MNTYSAFLLVAFLVIVKPLSAMTQTAADNERINSEMSAYTQSNPAFSKIIILSNSLAGDSVANTNRCSVILTKHNDGSLNLDLDQIDVTNAAGKLKNEKVVVHILSMSKFEIDLSSLPSGIYQIKTKAGSVTVEKK